MNTITIIGLGAGDLDQLALGTYKKLKEAEFVIAQDGSTSGNCGIKSGRH